MQQGRNRGVQRVQDSDLTVGDRIVQFCALIGALPQTRRVVIKFVLIEYEVNTKRHKVKGENR